LSLREAEAGVAARGASASIYASLFEGFGLPVLESLSVGTPCVASWSSAIPEVGGDACFWFDPLSAENLGLALLRVAAENPKVFSAHAARCRAIVEKFTWEAMLERILERVVPALGAMDGRQSLQVPELRPGPLVGA
jgi:glycosyltransferase involved in cell wall biosynthesis